MDKGPFCEYFFLLPWFHSITPLAPFIVYSSPAVLWQPFFSLLCQASSFQTKLNEQLASSLLWTSVFESKRKCKQASVGRKSDLKLVLFPPVFTVDDLQLYLCVYSSDVCEATDLVVTV